MKKLKNNSGATILMALLLILLAMAVGAAILTAAVSAAHHMKSDREAQQNYLTVSSAAELIRDSIAGDKYERTMTETHTAVRDTDGNITGENVSYSTNVTKPTGIMGAWLSACIENGNDNNEYASLKDFSDTIEVDLKIDDHTSLRTVTAAFFAQEDGKIQVQLSLKPEEGKTDDCRMTLTMQGTLTTEGLDTLPAEEEYVSTYKTIITWGSPKIVKGIADKGAGT